MFPPTRVDNTICSLVGVSSGTSDWANPVTRSHYWRDSYKDLLIETWSSLSLDRKTIALLCVAHRIVTLDYRPRRHSDDHTSTNPDGHRTVEGAAGRAGNCSTCCSLLLFVLLGLFIPRSLLTLRQRGRTLVIADSQVTLVRHDPDRAIHISDFKLGPNTRSWRHSDTADASRKRFRG